MSPGASARKISTDKGGRSQHPPFFFVGAFRAPRCSAMAASFAPCTAAPSRLMGRNRSREPLPQVLSPWNLQPRIAAGQPAREPILTLPGALTAYVLLLAVIHLRVLLPPDLEYWTIEVFGFIPKRYDSTLLAIDFPGGAGAKVWTFVTYSLLHANLSHHRLQRAVAAAVRQRAGAPLRRGPVFRLHGGDGRGRRAGASRHP